MKSSPLRLLSFLTVLLFFLTACNDSSDNKTESTTSSDSANEVNNTTSTANTNTIITTPQGMLIVKHRVKDFAAWKMAYEANDSVKLANGLHNYVIGRGVEDSNMVIVAVKADDLAKAKVFANGPVLKQAMQKSGVVGAPSVQVVNITFQDTAVLAPNTRRSFTTFKVKDWVAWEKNFKDGEQERLENGIVTRQYGHDADDNTRIRLVTALMDTAKAHAYWKSDMLKQRRAAGGVIGEPERFVFNVVQRY